MLPGRNSRRSRLGDAVAGMSGLRLTAAELTDVADMACAVHTRSFLRLDRWSDVQFGSMRTSLAFARQRQWSDRQASKGNRRSEYDLRCILRQHKAAVIEAYRFHVPASLSSPL